MIFKYQQVSKITTSLALATIAYCTLFTTSAAARTRNKKLKQKQKPLPVAVEPSQSLDLHVIFAQSFPETNAEISFDEKKNFYLADKKRTISVRNKPRIARSLSGRASWYGPGFHGRRTANGERYNQNALTAAHRHLRFGTKVRVTNLRNGRSVVVRINDRGPYAKGRVIDLSAAAAQTIGMIEMGVAPVSIEVLGI